MSNQIVPLAQQHPDPASGIVAGEERRPVNADAADATPDTPGIGGNSLFAESTRNTSGPLAPNLPFEAVYREKPLRPVTFPQTVPVASIGSPAPGANYNGGLGSSAYSSPLPGFDRGEQ